jgi:cyclin B
VQSRTSPRLGAFSACNNGGPLYAFASARRPDGLTDITNAAWADKMKNSRQVKPVHPQESSATTVEAFVAEDASTSITAADIIKINVQEAAEYAADIFNHLFHEELSYLPRADYMDGQKDITTKMRSILNDWLIEVHMKYRLRLETLHLAMNLIDRYLSNMTVTRKRLQLVGVVAMFIAAKYEEIHPPELREWVHITDNAYTKEDVLNMECSMLSVLNFQVTVPTAAHFFEPLQKANGCDGRHRALAQYILELGLLDIGMLQYTPSHVVSAALLLSNELLGRTSTWPGNMVQMSRHTETALRSCVDSYRHLLHLEKTKAKEKTLQAVRKKFLDPKRHAVADMSF